MEIFTERLNELVKQKQISKYKLAKDLGVNKQTVSFWLSGTNEPKISCLKEIARYFGVSSDYLLGLEDDFGVRVDDGAEEYSGREILIVKKIRSLGDESKKLIYQMFDV